MRWHLRQRCNAVRLLLIVWFSLVLATSTIPASVAAASSSSATGLVFEFSRRVSGNFWQSVVGALGRMRLSKIVGRPVVLVQRKQLAKGTEFFDVVQVALRGDCASGRDTGSTAGSTPLGWVNVVGGRIQPFIFVDCNQIARILERELRERPVSERERVMACAVSYVIVHELIHIVTQDPGHPKTGPQKAHVTQPELLSGASEISRWDTGVPTPITCPADEPTGTASVEDSAWVGANFSTGSLSIATDRFSLIAGLLSRLLINLKGG